MEYANLKVLIEYHPYKIETFADHANVTVDVLRAAIDGQGELSDDELCGISLLTGFSFDALRYPKLIVLDNKRYKHRRMMKESNDKLRAIIKAASEGSNAAIQYVERHWWNYEDATSPVWTKFINGEPIPYAMYFCGKWEKDTCLEDVENERRNIKKRNRAQEILDRLDEEPSQKNERAQEFLESVENLQQFVSVHGDSGIMWDVFMKLYMLISEYMHDSKKRERRAMQKGGAE